MTKKFLHPTQTKETQMKTKTMKDARRYLFDTNPTKLYARACELQMILDYALDSNAPDKDLRIAEAQIEVEEIIKGLEQNRRVMRGVMKQMGEELK
jgi:hypothetical protein